MRTRAASNTERHALPFQMYSPVFGARASVDKSHVDVNVTVIGWALIPPALLRQSSFSRPQYEPPATSSNETSSHWLVAL